MDFAPIASHDMQEPLRKVISMGDILQKKYGDAIGKGGMDYLHRMLGATERMRSLLKSLFDYSRVTTSAEPFQQVDLAAIVREVLSDLEVRIEKTGGEVAISELPTVEADPTQMRQLFQNLIGNGLKFYKEGDRPLVKVHCTGGDGQRFQITVEDNGIGFEEKDLDKVFAPFQRLHGRSSQYETGKLYRPCYQHPGTRHEVLLRMRAILSTPRLPPHSEFLPLAFAEAVSWRDRIQRRKVDQPGKGLSGCRPVRKSTAGMQSVSLITARSRPR